MERHLNVRLKSILWNKRAREIHKAAISIHNRKFGAHLEPAPIVEIKPDSISTYGIKNPGRKSEELIGVTCSWEEIAEEIYYPRNTKQ